MSVICARFDARAKQTFLSHLAVGGNAAAAARAVGISYSTAARHRKEDAVFAAEWDDIIALCYGTLEEAMMERARAGVKKMLWFKGEPIIDPKTGEQAFEVVYSDSREQFMLRGGMPEKYRERSSVDVHGSGDLSNEDTESLMHKVDAAFAAAAQRRAGAVEDAVIVSETPRIEVNVDDIL